MTEAAEPMVSGPAGTFTSSHRSSGYHSHEMGDAETLYEHPTFQRFDTKPQKVFTATQLPWRPFYLRRSVLGSFIATFAIIIAAIEALLAVSNKNDGIATSYHELHYLWTYGPTATLTLVAALWARVEYQSKLIAPWRRLMQRPMDAKDTLLLDYVSQFQLFAIFRALRNKDWTVSAACTVSALVRILIVISTGLITLSWTGVTSDSHPMLLQDTFSNNNARLPTIVNLPPYSLNQGLVQWNLSYPNGISKDYAFQSVLTNLPDSTETQVTVDGLTNGLDCVPTDVAVTGYDIGTMNLTVTSSGCNVKTLSTSNPVLTVLQPNGYYDDSAPIPASQLFARFAAIQCDEKKDGEGKAVLLMFGSFRNTQNSTLGSFSGTLHKSTQMICVPTYTIARLDVTRNGTQTQSVGLSPGGFNRSLESLHPWEIMDAHFDAYLARGSRSPWLWHGGPPKILTFRVDTDPYMEVAFHQLGPNPTVQPTDFFNPVFLKEFGESYYRQFAAVVAKQLFMEPASIETMGTATLMANRLVVRTWAAQLMVGLTVACLVLSIIVLFTIPRQGILPRNPSNLPDMAVLLLHSRDLQAKLCDLGAGGEKDFARALGRCRYESVIVHSATRNQAEFAILDQQQYAADGPQHCSNTPAEPNQHPGILHPASRLTFSFVLAGLIITLELLLQKSNREDGLGDVGNDTYVHYSWTTLPALVLGSITMAFSSMDFHVRSLAPYTMLKGALTANIFMVIDHLNMSVPPTIHKEIKLANIGALATSTMLIVASFFTIFSGSLFQALNVPSARLITLSATQSLGKNPNPELGSGAIASLILSSNLSYPSFTYQNLAFPHFLPNVTMDSSSLFNLSTAYIEAVVPALRSRLDCRLTESWNHRLNLTVNYTYSRHAQDPDYIDISRNNPLGIWIKGEECQLDPSYEDLKYNHFLETFSNATYFGHGGDTYVKLYTRGCSDLLYTWGKINYYSKPMVQHIASLGCNVTFERVDVDTTFFGPNLKIETSPERAPRAKEGTAQDTTIPVGVDNTQGSSQYQIYSYLSPIQIYLQLLDPFFATLISSRNAIPIADLGDEAANEKVADTIRFQHGIIQAQNLARGLVPASTSNVTLTSDSSMTNDAQPVYTGKVTDPTRKRVVQDAASTRILEALLGASLVLLIVGWVFTHQTDVLPMAPTSIAAVAALIFGGNLLEKLPADAQWRSQDEIAAAFGKGGNTKIWLGWGLVPDLEGRAMGGENENGVRRFGIFVVDEEDEGTDTMGGSESASGNGSVLGDGGWDAGIRVVGERETDQAEEEEQEEEPGVEQQH
ncbi:hypothetical protein F4808DRAFT_471695 [Astrocystis sublimbata]|nr:hypothetical protein F4808DRAFT_471695 [Astrocystis sublimbata]